MNIARIAFGVIYLLGAIANIALVTINGSQSYVGFADATFFPWYREAWMAVAAPNIMLIVILLIAFEIGLGLLFILKRKYFKIALILGILFCLASMPTMVEANKYQLAFGADTGISTLEGVPPEGGYEKYLSKQ